MATFKTAISDIGTEDVDKENQYRGQRKEAPKILDKRFYPTEQNRRSAHFTKRAFYTGFQYCCGPVTSGGLPSSPFSSKSLTEFILS